MKIAITSENKNGLESPIAGHFGHAPFFTIVEIVEGEIKSVEAIGNPFLSGHAPGQVPAYIHEKDASGIITGGMGSRAQTFFKDFGISVYSCTSGTVGDAVNLLIEGKLRTGEAGCGGNHGS